MKFKPHKYKREISEDESEDWEEFEALEDFEQRKQLLKN
jgi:hypothetical protein